MQIQRLSSTTGYCWTTAGSSYSPLQVLQQIFNVAPPDLRRQHSRLCIIHPNPGLSGKRRQERAPWKRPGPVMRRWRPYWVGGRDEFLSEPFGAMEEAPRGQGFFCRSARLLLPGRICAAAPKAFNSATSLKIRSRKLTWNLKKSPLMKEDSSL